MQILDKFNYHLPSSMKLVPATEFVQNETTGQYATRRGDEFFVLDIEGDCVHVSAGHSSIIEVYKDGEFSGLI